MKSKILKFALVCLICIGIVTAVVLLIETMSN